MYIKIKSINKYKLWCIIYKLIIDIVYVMSVSPTYGYSGLITDFKIIKYIISFAYFLAILNIIPNNFKRVSFMVLHLHFIVIIIPMFTFYSLSNQSDLFMFMVIVCFIIEIALIRNINLIKLIRVKHAKNVLNVVFIVITLISYLFSIKYNGISIDALNFNNVYYIRDNLNIPLWLGYLVNWQHSIINPYMTVKGIYDRNYFKVLLFCFLQFLLYLIMPFKVIIFSIPLILCIIFVLKRYNYYTISIIGLSIITLVFTIAKELILMPFALLVRLIYIPAQIKFQHYEVFTNIYDKLYYSEGIIGKILGLEYKFDMPSGMVVDSIFGTGTSNSNTGYIAYAYDNAGFIGMIIMSLIFVLIMVVFDSLSQSKDRTYIFALIFIQMLTLNDGDLLTLLLTGGLFLTILILFVSEKDFDMKESRYNRINRKINDRNIV